MADEALTAGAVARRLGVAVTTLRTWHQRYGLGPSHHVPGQHRRYTTEDMARLQVMRRLTAQGVTPAEAAAWARRVPMPTDASGSALPASHDVSAPGSPAPFDVSSSGSSMPGAHPAPSGSSVPGAHPAPSGSSVPEAYRAPDADASPGRAGGSAPTFTRAGDRRTPPLSNLDAGWPELDDHLFTARDGGGHAIPTGRAGPAARGLARAAMRLDGPAVRDIVEMTVTDRGVIGAWEEVIMPVLIGVGERYAATKRYIEVEHLLSRGISEVLGSVTRPPSSQSPRVLLAAADEEQHTLPLEALAAALAQAGVASRLLGARVPPQAVADAVARTGPAAVVLWSQLPGTGDPRQWSLLLSAPHPPVLTAAAGPGWLIEQLPEGVTLIASLTEAVHLVSAVVLPY